MNFLNLLIYLFVSLQVHAALFFKRLYSEHFPHALQSEVEEECKWVLRSMTESLRGAAENGTLFAGGDAGRFGPGDRAVVGEGSVRRSQCAELRRTFCSSNIDGLDLYARCYEWVHWSPLLSALGESSHCVLFLIDSFLSSLLFIINNKIKNIGK